MYSKRMVEAFDSKGMVRLSPLHVNTPQERHIPGVTVQMDGKDLTTRDLILGIEFENLSCEQAVVEYEKRGVITFERALSSMYSKRMVEAFDSKGMVRLSPLHVNTPQDSGAVSS